MFLFGQLVSRIANAKQIICNIDFGQIALWRHRILRMEGLREETHSPNCTHSIKPKLLLMTKVLHQLRVVAYTSSRCYRIFWCTTQLHRKIPEEINHNHQIQRTSLRLLGTKTNHPFVTQKSVQVSHGFHLSP